MVRGKEVVEGDLEGVWSDEVVWMSPCTIITM